MADAFTISVSNDNHAEEHSRRAYTPMSADRSLRKENVVVFDCGDDREHFNAFFRPGIEAYNARQKRADRKKSLDYFSDLKNGIEGYGSGKTQEKTVYHDVIQIGNKSTNGVTDDSFDVDHWRALKKEEKFEEASAYVKEHLSKSKAAQDFKEILIEIAEEIRDNKDHKYDGILTHGLVIHADEPNGTIHLDWRYTIYTDDAVGRKRKGKNEQYGIGTRVSMNKGLAKLGFKTTKTSTALEKFRDAIKDRIEEKMVERGYQRDIKGEHRKHQPTAVYEMEQRAKEAEKKKEELDGKVSILEAGAKVLDEQLNKKMTEIAEAEIKADGIIESAEKDAETITQNAERDARITKSKANSQAKQIITKAQTDAQTKIDAGEKEYQRKVKKADTDIAQMKQETEEATEAYSDMLFNWLAILRAKNNRQHIVDNFEYLVEVQEAIEKELQIREDAIDAQAKAAADDAVQKATADLERMKTQMALSRKAFENAKRQVESEIENDVKRDFRKEMQFSMELMNILQATNNPRVKTAAKIVKDFVRPEQDEIVKAYEIVKKQNAEQMKEHIQSIADDLENQIASGDQYE